MRCLIPLLAVLVLPAAAQARQPDPCAQAVSTIDVNTCMEKVLKARDRELNVAYQDLLKTLVKSEAGDTTDYARVRKELTAAQRAWVQYRDNDCNAQYTYHAQGTYRGPRYLGCMVERTEQRTRELLDWARP
jgi:uncharacterized protein YecT (DUF1311 family)